MRYEEARAIEELTQTEKEEDAREAAAALTLKLLLEAVRCRHRFRNYSTLQMQRWNQDLRAIRRHKETLRMHFVETHDAAVTCHAVWARSRKENGHGHIHSSC